MKQLTLMRHAKSSWDDDTLDDFDRPLNERGQNAAPLMGSYLSKHGLQPDCIFCSSALRTKQTLSLMAPYHNNTLHIDYIDKLYLASSKAIKKVVNDTPTNYDHVMIIGHNPGLHMLAMDLATKSGAPHNEIMGLAEKFPTAAIAHYSIETTSWRDAFTVPVKLNVFTSPKQLTHT